MVRKHDRFKSGSFFRICLSGSLPTESLFVHAQGRPRCLRLRIRDFMVASELAMT
jgi:hypothetical protein